MLLYTFGLKWQRKFIHLSSHNSLVRNESLWKCIFKGSTYISSPCLLLPHEKNNVGIFFSHFCYKSKKLERLVLYPAKMRNCIITALLEKVEYDKVVQKSLNICKITQTWNFGLKHSHHRPICTFKKVCSFGNSFSQMYCKYYKVDFSTVQNARSSREERGAANFFTARIKFC